MPMMSRPRPPHGSSVDDRQPRRVGGSTVGSGIAPSRRLRRLGVASVERGHRRRRSRRRGAVGATVAWTADVPPRHRRRAPPATSDALMPSSVGSVWCFDTTSVAVSAPSPSLPSPTARSARDRRSAAWPSRRRTPPPRRESACRRRRRSSSRTCRPHEYIRHFTTGGNSISCRHAGPVRAQDAGAALHGARRPAARLPHLRSDRPAPCRRTSTRA